MKNLLLLLFVFASVEMTAQCNQTIFPSPGMIQISSNATINDTDGNAYWICQGLTVNVTASAGCTYMLEENVTLNVIDTDGDQVFAKSGCTINNSSSGLVGIAANPSTISFTNTGGGTTLINITCTAVTYNYSMVGGGSPCNVLAIEEEKTDEVRLFPNPVATNGVLKIESDQEIKSIQLVNLLGETILVSKITDNGLNLQGITSGTYFVRIEFSGSVLTEKIIVE